MGAGADGGQSRRLSFSILTGKARCGVQLPTARRDFLESRKFILLSAHERTPTPLGKVCKTPPTTVGGIHSEA